MGRKKGSGKPWQHHFSKRIEIVHDNGTHMVWTGRVNSRSVPMFTAISERKNKPLSKTAVWFAYWLKNGHKKPKSVAACHPVKICKVDRCINPDCYTDYTPEKLSPNTERDKEIRRLHAGYLEFRQYTMAGIGRKYGISRQRVEQILKERVGKE